MCLSFLWKHVCVKNKKYDDGLSSRLDPYLFIQYFIIKINIIVTFNSAESTDISLS